MIAQLILALLGAHWRAAKLAVIGVCWSVWLGWRVVGGIDAKRKDRRP
jgi:hypothetical protein